MEDESCVSKIVTTFLLNTCRLPPKLSKRDVQAAVLCATTANFPVHYYRQASWIPLITGSVAEFYIEPMLPNFGDIDVMHHDNYTLAIPRGHPLPTQLPADYHNRIEVHEIVDVLPEITGSHLPGYVYLKLRYLINTDGDKYSYKVNTLDDDSEGIWLAHMVASRNDERNRHGPAICHDFSETIHLSYDDVICMRCLVWPPQAADWPTRHRNYGWPDSATLDRVVSNGCDLVGVTHRQCKQHKWMSRYQWRLSFSRAEIVLINSWMPVQQIVYHMLRYFVKIERLTDCADNSGAGTLSNYHIKTLMLWTCELKPRGWWTDNLNLVRICVELMQTLSVWLTDTRCPHYFISNCNLLDNSFNVGSVAPKFVSMDEGYLSTWIVNNYIKQCAQLCPYNVSWLFSDVSTSEKLQNATSEICRWRLNTSMGDLWRSVNFAEYQIPFTVSLQSFTARSCVYWMNEMAKIDARFPGYFSAVALLHVVRKVTKNGFNEELMAILSTILGRYFSQCCSDVLSLRKTELNTSAVVDLLLKSAVEHLTTYRQLRVLDFSSVVTIATADYEAMYAYKRGDYQRCLQLSTQNVNTLLRARRVTDVPTFPEFIQLLDDDIVSLTALTLVVNPKFRGNTYGVCVTQLTVSLSLLTQCQFKLHHSVPSLTQTLLIIKLAQRRLSAAYTLDHLTLKLAERKVRRLTRNRYAFQLF